MNTEFINHSALHYLTVAVCFAFMLFFCWGAVRLRRRSIPAERRLRVTWAIIVAISQFSFTIFWATGDRYDIRLSLPLHLCDIAGFIAPFALVFSARLPRALLYFWGLGLSVCAYIAPVLTKGPSEPEFWVFWISHTQIVGSALYILWVTRYRPDWPDTVRVIGILVVYGAAMALINNAIGANYAFVGPTHAEYPAPFDDVGPWPGRVVLILAVEALLMMLLWAPWGIARRFKRRKIPTGIPPNSGG